MAFPFACLVDGLNTITTLLFDPNPTQALLVASDRKAMIIRNLSVARQSRTKYSMHTHSRQHGFLRGPGRGLNFFRIRELWLQSKAAAKNCTNLTNERARACGFQSPRITPTQRHSQNEFGQSIFILTRICMDPGRKHQGNQANVAPADNSNARILRQIITTDACVQHAMSTINFYPFIWIVYQIFNA